MGIFDNQSKTAFTLGMNMLGAKVPAVPPKDGNGIQAGSDTINIKKNPDEIDVAIWGGKAR